jgi:Fe(3+) dicitrate transport protein
VKAAKAEHGFELGLRLHSDYMDRFQWTDGYRMSEGTMLQTSVGRPGTESNRISSADAVAAHFMYDLTVGRFGIHPGLRTEHIVMREENYGTQDPYRTGVALKTVENTVDVWIPGIGVDFDLTKTTLAFVGVHRGFSPPGTDPETMPESSVNYEAGVRHNAGSLEIQVIGFLNDYSELLGSDLAAAGGDGTGDLFNGGKALVEGAEFFASLDLLARRSERFRVPVNLGYTFTDASFGSSFISTFAGWGLVLDGDPIPYIAKHQVNGRIGFEARKYSVNLSVNHMGEMPGQAGPVGDGTEYLIPSFTVIDLGATYRFAPQAEVFGTVQNLLDQAYLVSNVPAGNRPGMPRAVQAGVRFRF